MNQPSQESPEGDPNPSQDLPAEDNDTRSLSDDVTFGDQPDYDPQSFGDAATFGDQPARGPRSLGDEATFGDGLGGSDSELFDDDMEIVDLEARYTIESTLGKGGMGEVLLATDTRLNRKVAIKRILGSAARSKTAVSRFLTEAQSVAALNHPNIVQIYDYGRAKDGPFLIMEYVEGNSLLDRCREAAIPVEESIDLICQLCDGLGRAHAANIIHRDIKPANVLLTTEGVPKLTDFGLAKDEAADTGMTMQGAVLGTLDFMPPEQRKDASLTDARSDLWSLAATFYQMVTGKSPRIIRFGDVPKSLHNVLSKALEDKKADRYQTALEFSDAIRKSSSNPGVKVTIPVELGTGECYKCHTRNDASRKFCNSCGASLRVGCLKCEASIPVWDKFCPECGCNQPATIAANFDEFKVQLKSVEKLIERHAYEEATEIVELLEDIDDLRFGSVVKQATELKDLIVTNRAREIKKAQKQFKDAKEQRKAFDYEGATACIEAIPEPLRDRDVMFFFDHLRKDGAELNEILSAFKKRPIEIQKISGALNKIKRAEVLGGPSKISQSFLEELISHKKREAEELLRNHRFPEAVAVGTELESINKKQFKEIDLWVSDFLSRVKRIEKSEQARSELKQVKKSINEFSDDEDLVELLKKIERAENLGASRKEFQAKIEGWVEFRKNKAESLFSKQKYDQASALAMDLKSVNRSGVRVKGVQSWVKEFLEKVETKKKSDVERAGRDRLLTEIENFSPRRPLDQLLDKIHNLNEFGGLSEELHERHVNNYLDAQKNFAEAEEKWSLADYEGVLNAIDLISKPRRDSEILELEVAAKDKVEHAAYKALLVEGYGLLKKGALDQALTLFSDAKKTQTKNFDALVGIACVQSRLGKRTEAISTLRGVLSRSPGHGQANYNLACYLRLSGQESESVEMLDEAVKIDRRYASMAVKDKDFQGFDFNAHVRKILNEAGRLYEREDYFEAEQCYELLSRWTPNQVGPLERIASCRFRRGDIPRAINKYDQITDLFPEDARPFYNKACCFAKTAQAENAVLNLEKAISLDKSLIKKARNDHDFSVMQKNADFLNLVNPKWHNPLDRWKPTDVAVPERELKIRKSRAVISDDRLVAFFRSAENSVHAIKLVNKELDEGKSLDEIFYTGDDCGYEIDVSQSGESNFVIGFSCTEKSAEELLGDGGEWRVSYRENEIQELENLGFWMT